MTETITSKYYIGYWVRLVMVSIFGLSRILSFALGILIKASAEYLITQVILLIIVLCVVIYWLRNYPMQKITVSEQNIMIDQYLTRKHIVIKYTDIDKIRTTGSTDYSLWNRNISSQTLEIELFNQETYRLSSRELDNYGALKNAIYDNMWRHKQ